MRNFTKLREIFLMVALCGFLFVQSSRAQIMSQSTQPTTAPSLDPQTEIQNLKAQVADLLKANASLRSANDALLKRLDTHANPPVAVAPARAPYHGTTFVKRTTEFLNHTRLYDASQKPEVLATAAKIDKEIAAYVKKNSLDKDAEASLYAGELKLGMTEEELNILGTLTVNLEWSTSKSCTITLWQPDTNESAYDITIAGGKVTSIDHTAHEGPDAIHSSTSIHSGQIAH